MHRLNLEHLLFGISLFMLAPGCSSIDDAWPGSTSGAPIGEGPDDGLGETSGDGAGEGASDSSTSTSPADSFAPGTGGDGDGDGDGDGEAQPPFADYAGCELDGEFLAYCNTHDDMMLDCLPGFAQACEAASGQIVAVTLDQISGEWPCSNSSPLLVSCTDQFQSDCGTFFNGEFDCTQFVGETCVEGVCTWPEPG
jgi:hypothetical protein